MTTQKIAELVKSKAAAAAAVKTNTDTEGASPLEAPKMREQRLAWESLKDKPLYLLEVWVKAGKQSIRIQGEDLAIAPDVLEQLNAIASGGYSAKISKRLKEAAGRLQSLQKKFYTTYTTYADPFRFVHENQLPEALNFLQTMQTEADTLRAELIEHYEEEFTQFLEAIAQILDKAGLDRANKDAALQRYTDSYPLPDDWANNSLKIVVEGPTKIKSLLQTMQEDTRLSKAAAEQAIAEAEAELERQKIEAEKQKLEAIALSQKNFARSLASAIGEAQIKARDEAYGEIADLIDRFAVVDPANPTNRTLSAWSTALDRLRILSAHDTSLKPLVEGAEAIVQIYQSDTPDTSELAEKLEAFQNILQTTLKKDSTGEGSSKLGKMLSFEGQYKDLISKLEHLEKHPDLAATKELEGKIEAIANLYHFRQKELEKKLKATKESLQASLNPKPRSKKPSPPENSKGSEVFDPEAGF